MPSSRKGRESRDSVRRISGDGADAGGETKATGRSSASAKTALSSARSHGSKAFGASSRRALRLDVMGEETPGPGAYMPLSTFAKAASGASYNPGSSTTSSTASSIRAPKGMPTALFRSRSPQRGKVGNQLTPGPGTHTPIFSAQEPNPNRNAAPHMAAKGSACPWRIGMGNHRRQQHRKGGAGLVRDAQIPDVGARHGARRLDGQPPEPWLWHRKPAAPPPP